MSGASTTRLAGRGSAVRRATAGRMAGALAALLCLSGSAAAGVLTCRFTEPFFVIDFDSATGIVTLASPDESDPETGRIAPRDIAEGAKLTRSDVWVGYPTLTLDAGDQRILDLRLSGQGSDGMSETVFPMEGVYGTFVGGCEATKAPAYDLLELYQDLGIEP